MPGLTELELSALWLSLQVAFWCVTTSLPVGIGIAWLLARREFRGKILLNGIVHLPLVVPPVVIGFLLLILLGRNGPVGSWLESTFGITLGFSFAGAVIASAVMAFPLLVRAIRLSIEAIDRRVENTARTLGAGPFDVFFSITLPLALPGVLVGSVLAFARSLGEFGATITFVSSIPGVTQTLPLALYNLVQVPGGEASALRLVIISVALAIGALLASEILARRIKARIEGADDD